MLREKPCNRLTHGLHQLVALAALTVLVLFGGVRWAISNTVSAIGWDVDSSGRTTVTIVCAEPVDPESFRSFPIPDPPRAVIVLEGITNKVEPGLLTIENRDILRVRLGHHPERPIPELHIVLDLQSDEVQILDIRHDGNRLIAEVGTLPRMVATSIPIDSPMTSPPVPLLPSPTTPPTPLPLTPTPSPTPFAHTPTPSSTPSPTPTASQPFPDRPAPPILPPPSREPSPYPTIEPTRAPHDLATPTPDPDPVTATRIVDIATSLRGDGSTLLRITADGRLPQGCARTLEVNDDPPRIILTIRGVSAPSLSRTLAVGDTNLDRIRLIHDAETSEGELHLLLYLARAGVAVTAMNQVGPNLAVQLGAAESATITP